MKRILLTIFLILILFLPACSTWTARDKTLLTASILATAADAYTTCRGLSNPGNYEINPVLGKHPGNEQVVTYLIFTEIVTILIAHYVPSWRPWLLGGKTVINTAGAINNLHLEW